MCGPPAHMVDMAKAKLLQAKRVLSYKAHFRVLVGKVPAPTYVPAKQGGFGRREATARAKAWRTAQLAQLKAEAGTHGAPA